MRYDFGYGAGFLPLEINGRLTVDTMLPPTTEEFSDTENAIVEILQKPLDSGPFSQMISGVSSAAVVVNSIPDIEAIPQILNGVLDNLSTSISDSIEVSVICPISNKSESNAGNAVALGIANRDDYQLILHDPHVKDDLCHVGDTPTYCTPIHVNKAFMDAEVKIGIGTIRSDIFVGATGGRMSVLPSSTGIKSIARNLKLQATHPSAPFVTESVACTDLEEASRLAGLDFIINAIPDWKNNLKGIVAGNPYTSWRKGIKLARSVTETHFHHKADIVMVSAGGAQNDETLYNAVDALYAGKAATEHGGVIVLIAECTSGPGPYGFIRGVSECSSGEEVSILAETGFEIGMEKARFFWDVLESRKVIICSRMRESLVAERFHSYAVKDPQEGYELAKTLIVSRPRIAVIPNGSRTLPVMKNY